MDDITKTNVLAKELALIKDNTIGQFTIECLMAAPDYFWTLAASTGGDHHPPDERNEGGLILHTKRVVKMVLIISRIEDLPQFEQDLLVSAAILHDTWRCGRKGQEKMRGGHLASDSAHAIYPAYEFWDIAKKHEIGHDILNIVALHYGRWSKVRIEQCCLGQYLHYADCIAANEDVQIIGV